MWGKNLGTQAGVHLLEGVYLIQGPLNTGFIVYPTSSGSPLDADQSLGLLYGSPNLRLVTHSSLQRDA